MKTYKVGQKVRIKKTYYDKFDGRKVDDIALFKSMFTTNVLTIVECPANDNLLVFTSNSFFYPLKVLTPVRNKGGKLMDKRLLTEAEIYCKEAIKRLMRMKTSNNVKIVSFYAYQPYAGNTLKYYEVFDKYEKQLAKQLNITVEELAWRYTELWHNWNEKEKLNYDD